MVKMCRKYASFCDDIMCARSKNIDKFAPNLMKKVRKFPSLSYRIYGKSIRECVWSGPIYVSIANSRHRNVAYLEAGCDYFRTRSTNRPNQYFERYIDYIINCTVLRCTINCARFITRTMFFKHSTVYFHIH